MPRINQTGVSNRYAETEYAELKRRSDLTPADEARLRDLEAEGYGEDRDGTGTARYAGEHGPEFVEPHAGEVKANEKGGEETSPGTSSSASSDKTPKSNENDEKDPRPTAPAAGQHSGQARTGSSTASSTATSGKAKK